MPTINQNLMTARQQLISDYEANLLLAHVLGVNLAWLRTWPEYQLSDAQQDRFATLCQRRQAQEPIAYLLGAWAFWSFSLQVTPDTLIPRPETEHLIDWVLQQFAATPSLIVADLGTGSGAIALALALERPSWQVMATDISATALAVAKNNARNLNLPQIEWYLGAWYQALPADTRCDLIVSNPPYIAADDLHLQQDGLPYEPRSALVAENNGMADLMHLITEAAHYLKPCGWLVLEHGYNQAAAVNTLFQTAGFSNIATLKDYAGCDRISCGQLMT